MDGGVGPLWVLDDVYILHHQGLASDSDDRSGRHLLGYCLLGVSRLFFLVRLPRTDGDNSALLDRLRKRYILISSVIFFFYSCNGGRWKIQNHHGGKSWIFPPTTPQTNY